VKSGMKIGIVNDLAVACEALRRAVAQDQALEVAWIARDGVEAVECARRARPDVILMDLIMPRMDGVEATREIMRVAPCPILVVTATVTGNASLVYEALGAGALDAVNTPTFARGAEVDGAAELLRRIRLIARVESLPVHAPQAAPAIAPAAQRTSRARVAPALGVHQGSAPGVPIVAIGASTGGPRAVADVIRALPRPFPAALLVVQHVSQLFVQGFAEWLAAETGARVVLARAGHAPQAGEVLVAAEDRHLVLASDGRLAYRDEPVLHPSVQLHRPAVDELFASLAAGRQRGVAVLLTGMGRDGAEGMLRLRRAGWHTIAQDQATSIVWGMPGAAVELGAACEVLPITAIAGAITGAIARKVE